MKKVYFVRHGSTPGNEAMLYKLETEQLSEKGIQQAQFVAKRFKDIPIDVIISSDMSRAAQTAEVIAKELQKELVLSDLFREILRPSEVRNRPQKDPEIMKIMQQVKDHQNDPSWHYSDEENFHDLKKRAQKCLDYITSLPKENILIVSHGYMQRMILSVLLLGNKLVPDNFNHFNYFFVTENTGITMIQEENGVFRLLTWNDYAHLG